VAAIGSFAPSRVGPKGGFLGGQLGYNRQFNHVVLGVEGDGQWSDQRDTQCGFICSPFFATTVTHKLPWFATARGRIGWAQPSYLLYVTGGAAWGAVNEVDNHSTAGIQTAATFNQVKSGWTGGGGIEVRLWERWTGKIEYLHVDLGSTTNTFVVAPGETLTTSSSIRNDIVRLGLNYRIGG
jgi:outer membrane immunogenic protein